MDMFTHTRPVSLDTHTHLLQVNTVYILRFIHSVNSKPPAKTYITRAPIYASL